MKSFVAMLLPVALLLACASPMGMTLWTVHDERGLVLNWQPIEVGAGIEEFGYELVVFQAVQKLPREQVLRVEGLTATQYLAVGLPRGDYVFSVRGRYRRDGQVWATDWLKVDPRVHASLVPARGHAAFTVP